jgi:hypothetical protein
MENCWVIHSGAHTYLLHQKFLVNFSMFGGGPVKNTSQQIKMVQIRHKSGTDKLTFAIIINSCYISK